MKRSVVLLVNVNEYMTTGEVVTIIREKLKTPIKQLHKSGLEPKECKIDFVLQARKQLFEGSDYIYFASVIAEKFDCEYMAHTDSLGRVFHAKPFLEISITLWD